MSLLNRSQLDTILSQDVASIAGFNGQTQTSDWIMDVAISPADDDSCALVTAHNTVLKATLHQGEAVSVGTLSSPSRSILYSAHLTWVSPASILVAAGTVFGEIIVWECSSLTNAGLTTRVIGTFTGHEGSIFGVDISPPIVDQNGRKTRLLASCSDDRTIRVWDIYSSSENLAELEDDELARAFAIRQGSLGDGDLSGNAARTRKDFLAMVMGHSSRIWSVKFHIEEASEHPFPRICIISHGEDSTSQHWVLDLSSNCGTDLQLSDGGNATNRDLANLTHLKTFGFHSGNHIWSTATHRADSSTVVATGGADGKVSLFELPRHSPDEVASPITQSLPTELSTRFRDLNYVGSTSWDIEEILTEFPVSLVDQAPVMEPLPGDCFVETTAVIANGKPKKKCKVKKTPRDAFNRYSFINEKEVIATTNFGRILLGTIDQAVRWTELTMPEGCRLDLSAYSIVKGVTKLGVAILAGAKGSIFMYSGGVHILKVGQVIGKVADIFPAVRGKSSLDFAVTTLGSNVATLFTIEIPDISEISPVLSVSSTVYHLPERIIVTSICIAHTQLILGARNGSLAFYDLSKPCAPSMTWKPEKNGDALTSIISLSSSPDNKTRYILTTGREGLYTVYAISHQSANVYPVHFGTPPLGSNIEHAWFDNNELILNGFKGKNFVVWNETTQCELMNVPCGGAHRSFAYSELSSGARCFVYAKQATPYIHYQPEPSHRIIKSGGHGREIKSTAISPDKTLIATGAEDTSIRIWRYCNSDSSTGKQPTCVAVTQKHSAGVQHLQWHGSNYLFSSGGNEEFFVWAVQEIPGFGIGVVCEASCPDQTEEKDLRIMSFDVVTLDSSSTTDREVLLISLAYSDSTIRIYRYCKTEGFRVLSTGRYTSSCLMQIRWVQQSNSEAHFLTAATDGNLVLWKTALSVPSTLSGPEPNAPSIISKHKLHQSTIKALDLTTTPENIVIATGGDDNALAITIYSFSNLAALPRSIILRTAHAAAITALCVIVRRESKELRVVSSSNDQRVKEWSVLIDEDSGMGMKKVGDSFTSVADIGDVAILLEGDSERTGGKVLVVGNGMEVFDVSTK